MKLIIFVVLLLLMTFNLNSQKLLLKSGSYDIQKEKASNMNFDGEIALNGQFFKVLVFSELPDNQTKEKLKSKGFNLLDYLPQKSFLVSIDEGFESFDFSEFKITKVLDFKNEFKLSKKLKNRQFPAHVILENDEIQLVAQYFSTLSISTVENILDKYDLQIVERLESSNSLLLQFPKENLNQILKIDAFQYIDFPTPPGEPENLPGRTEHRSNLLWQGNESGLNYRADDFKIMMQDDGFIGPHIDFEGRTDQSDCEPCSTDPSNDHGDHVAGTIMGAGNLDPKARGMAHGSDLLVYNSSNNNYNVVPSLYINQNVYITSKSYSNGCNSGYTGLTQSLDQQVYTYPSLIHVFSAGNDGNSDCDYGAGSGWGNITGGHKSGKNVLAVGNLNNTSELISSSSRGPATDGRIKPDICGVGTQVYSTIPNNDYGVKTGTSMSCPGVSGVIAQLYDAYQDINNGDIPNSGLIKALLLNGADDIGNPGPDFKHGWGSVNARRSFDMIKDENYFSNSIDNGQQQTHQINVPSGTKEIKVMVYWTDIEGSTSAATALVNDLNIILEDPNSDEFLPWVLDPTPNATTLDEDAIRDVDSLNNMEQVTITDPIPGQYNLNIDGYNIPFGPQEYFVVYSFIQDDIKVTYPSGFESLTPNENHLIRWDAAEGNDPFTISFSEDDGGNWTVIGNAPPNERHLTWSIPNTVTGLGRIKVERNGLESISDTTFSIIGVPNSFDLEWMCPDSMMLSWDPVIGAEGYEISELGSKYMDSIAFVTDTNIVLQYPSTYESWFSVKTLGNDNAIGERAIAVQKLEGQKNCFWSAPVAEFSLDCPSAGQEYCFTLFDESENIGDNPVDYTWYFPDGNPAVSNDPSPQVCYDDPGDFDVILVVETPSGKDSLYIEDYINVLPASYLPYFENFQEHTSFNNNPFWSVERIGDGTIQFSPSLFASLSGDRSAFLANYVQPSDAIYRLTSGPIDLSGLDDSEDVTVSFRYAYKKRSSSNNERLSLFVTTGCDNPFVPRFSIFGNSLSSEVESDYWVPANEDDWTTVHVTTLNSNFYDENFRMRFEFEADGGNNLFIDNINIYEGEPSDDIVDVENITKNDAEFEVFPNPASNELNLRFSQNQDGKTQIFVRDVTGKVIEQNEIMGKNGNNLVLLDTRNLNSGTYFVSLKKEGIVQTRKVVIQ